MRRQLVQGLVTGLCAVPLVCAAAGDAQAAGTSAYGQWASGASGTMTVPVTGFPSAEVTSNASNPRRQSGASAFLNAATPFAAAYGSSQNKPYLLVNAASGGAPSTTRLSFAESTPVGWGFALGDVDAETVRIEATGADGQPLSAAELGWRGGFNYCNGVSPKPSSCTGTHTDLPVWDAGTRTLVGNVADTGGASGWFRPTVPVRSLTLTLTVQTGIPVYQLWIAAPTSTVSGRVADSCVDGDRHTVRLLDADGNAVTDESGQPITTTTDADGHYTFRDLMPRQYRVALDVPAGLVVDRHTASADTAVDDAVSGVDFSLSCPAPTVAPPLRFPIGMRELYVPLPDADPQVPVVVTVEPSHGTVQVDPRHHRLVYRPKKGFHGKDSFVYVDRAPNGRIHTHRVTVVVPQPRPAVVAPDRDVHRPQLAATGVDGTPWAAASVGLVTGGGTLLLLTRRRRRRG